jgi:integrase
MRVCELRALSIADVTDRGVIVWKSLTDRLKKVRKGYAKEQFYPLPKYIMDDLLEHIKGKSPDEFIFTVNGSPYKLGTLRNMWYRVLDKLEISRIELNQGGRHTWASREMRNARDEALARIQKQLGHTNKKTSQRHYIIEE